MVLTDSNLNAFDTSKVNGSPGIYVFLTSVDTPVCEQQAKVLAAFIKKDSENPGDLEFIIVSADRHSLSSGSYEAHDMEDRQVTFLSGSLAHEFGHKQPD